MLLIPNYVGPSAIEGVGVFAAAPVAEGTVIWKLDERFDLLFSEDEVERLEGEQRLFAERYGYSHTTRPGFTVIELDNGRFMNHSDRPNTLFTDPQIGWAIRDIAEGEEITCDYSEFEPGFTILPGRTFVEIPACGAELRVSPG